MAILINMDMPESCYYCRFASGGWTKDHGAWCDVMGVELPAGENARNCPVKEVDISEYGMTREAEKRVIENARYEIWHAQSELLYAMDIDPEDYDCKEIEDMTLRPNTFSLMQSIIAQGTSTAGGTSCWKEIYAIEEECGKFGDTD